MANILITGCNRGIGLELVRQYAQAGWRTFATCRHPGEATALQQLSRDLDNISVHRLDICVMEDISAIVSELENTPIDILFNNAGVYLEEDYPAPELGGIRYDQWLRTFDVNTLGAVRLTEALRANVAKSRTKLVVAMTSHMGSIADINTPGSYYYRTSKAALNAAMRGLALALYPQHIGVLLLHPGGVFTRMSPGSTLSTEQSVKGLRKVIDNFTLENTGGFFRYDGVRLPW